MKPILFTAIILTSSTASAQIQSFHRWNVDWQRYEANQRYWADYYRMTQPRRYWGTVGSEVLPSGGNVSVKPKAALTTAERRLERAQKRREKRRARIAARKRRR